MDISYAEHQDYETQLEAIEECEIQVEYDSFFVKLWQDIFGK
jgi:hypothetical protein